MAYIKREPSAIGAMKRWRRWKKPVGCEVTGSEAENVTSDNHSRNSGRPRSGGLHGVLYCSSSFTDRQGREDASALGQDLLLGDGGRGIHGDGAGDLASHFILGVRRGVQLLLCVPRISCVVAQASAGRS